MIVSIFRNTNYSDFSDESLMHHLAQGKSGAFDEIYNRYATKLYHYFYRLLNKDQNKAQDFTQDLFLKVMQAADSFDTKKSFNAWIYTLANNMCRNEWRNQSNRTNILNRLTVETLEQPNAAQRIDQKILNQHVEQELQKFSVEDQSLIALRFQQELTIIEIAHILDLPEGTVKSRLFYLMKKLSVKLSIYAPNYHY